MYIEYISNAHLLPFGLNKATNLTSMIIPLIYIFEIPTIFNNTHSFAHG